MTMGDKIVNTLTGSNIRTVRVTALQLSEIIYNCFVREEQNVDNTPGISNEKECEKRENYILKILRGRFFLYTDIDSSDGKYHLHISHFRRGLTVHRIVWVKYFETEEIFEWKGYTLGPVKRAFSQWTSAERIRRRKGHNKETVYFFIEKLRRKQRIRRLCTFVILLAAISIPGYLWYSDYLEEQERKKMIAVAEIEMKNGNYNDAYELYKKAGKYANNKSVMNCMYMMIQKYCDTGTLDDFNKADNLYYNMSGAKQKEAGNLILESKYNLAIRYYNDGLYDDAEEYLNIIHCDYKEKERYLEKLSKISEDLSSIYGTYKFAVSPYTSKAVKSSVLSLSYTGKSAGLNYTVLSYTGTEKKMSLKLKNQVTGETIDAIYYKNLSELINNNSSYSHINNMLYSSPSIYLEDPAAGYGFYEQTR